mmetsp:Transcript_12803/g.36672  ORF Transcript_12803/g.36672 Transcript_12803/m.36672 type:complete len:278 (-) Transcript_12803:809-1642(-)
MPGWGGAPDEVWNETPLGGSSQGDHGSPPEQVPAQVRPTELFQVHHSSLPVNGCGERRGRGDPGQGQHGALHVGLQHPSSIHSVGGDRLLLQGRANQLPGSLRAQEEQLRIDLPPPGEQPVLEDGTRTSRAVVLVAGDHKSMFTERVRVEPGPAVLHLEPHGHQNAIVCVRRPCPFKFADGPPAPELLHVGGKYVLFGTVFISEDRGTCPESTGDAHQLVSFQGHPQQVVPLDLRDDRLGHVRHAEVLLIGKHGGDDHGEITRRVHERFDDDREEHI